MKIIHFIIVFFGTANCLKNAANFNYLELPHYRLIITAMKALPEDPCTIDIRRYVEGIQVYERWAMIMFDSTVKFPYGLMHGNAYQLGNFDECIDLQVPGNATVNHFQGQYCLGEINVSQKLKEPITEEMVFQSRKVLRQNRHSMRWALCIPSTCDAKKTQMFVREIFARIIPGRHLNISISDKDCYYKQPVKLTSGQTTYCVIIGTFLLFILLATSFDCLRMIKLKHFNGYQLNEVPEDPSTLCEVILAFSVIRNVQKLVEVRSKNNELNLDCICGIRVISMGFILIGHASIFLISSPVLNRGFTYSATKQWQYAPFTNNPLLVDTFLLVSGFLMCRLLLVELEKGMKILNIFGIYLARYIRLTPAYLVIIGFYCTFLVNIGEGPLWKARMTVEQDRCLNSWWANVAYINNYVNTESLCMFQSWYLAVDMQLFIVGTLIVCLLNYFSVIGEIIMGMLCFASAVIPFIITKTKNLEPTLMIYPEEISDLSTNYFYKNYYIKTHMRAGSYLLGITFGYIVHKVQSKSTKIWFLARVLVGTLAFIAGAGGMFSIVIFYQDNYEHSAKKAAWYAAVHRFAWSFAIGWVLFVAITCDSYVNRILSWRVWTLFSKLTYCAYLVNGFVELYSYGQMRAPRFLSIYTLGSEAIAHIVLTLILAFILCVLFESPIHSLEKLFLRSKKKQTSSEGNNNHAVEPDS